MSMDLQLLKNAESFVTEMLDEHLSENLTYHNLDHTKNVVKMVEEISQNSEVSADEIYQLKMAAWFHDVGYLHNYDGHEKDSIRIAEEYLRSKNADEELITKVSRLIEVTELEVMPETLLEKVIKDADMFHLGSPKGLVYTDELRNEYEHFKNTVYTDESWDKLNYKFYRDHDYYTQYANEKFGQYKSENTLLLKKKVKKAKNKVQKEKEKKNRLTRAALEIQVSSLEEKLTKTKNKLKKTEQLRPDRGIETMYRTTYRTHIALSSIADNKANILLSISTLLMGIIFTEVINGIGELKELDNIIAFPLIAVIVVCMATIIFAILATRPKVNSGVFTREDIIQKKTNLLFFGNYHGMPLDDYLWGVGEMMKDAEYLYGSMSKDLFFLGKVLAKKFQYLRIAYNIFMYGIILSLLVALVAYIVTDMTAAA
ncbi:MAG: Pycsar system effector family protein [Bacteroidota bacterium]